MHTADCGPPTDFTQAVEVYFETFIGSTVTFVSRPGYFFKGEIITIEATCEEPGVWKGIPSEEPQGEMVIKHAGIS